jgi:hypothetical protein
MGAQEKTKKKENECGRVSEDLNNYITGSALGDALLTISTILFVVISFFLLAMLLSCTSWGRRITLGKEGSRIAAVRKSRIRFSQSSV